jgi:hypothetical protein
MRFIFRFLKRNATYKGLLGGSRGWLTLFGIFTTFRFFGKYVGREEQYLTKETLKPGQAMTITAIAPPSRRENKAAKRQAVADAASAKAAASAAKAAAKQAKVAAKAGARAAKKLSSTNT